jgi:hypothetical protein
VCFRTFFWNWSFFFGISVRTENKELQKYSLVLSARKMISLQEGPGEWLLNNDRPTNHPNVRQDKKEEAEYVWVGGTITGQQLGPNCRQ